MAIAPLPDRELLDAFTATRPPLRLLSFPGEGSRAADRVDGLRTCSQPRQLRAKWSKTRRARLRRTGAFVLFVALLGALAAPVSALAGTGGAAASSPTQGSTYTVRPGDTLRSIAIRLDPSGNPRSIVRQLAAETGSDTVVVGEHIRLP
jgi:hypothetical protein